MVKHMNENANQNIILEVKDLKLHFPIYRGLIQRPVGYVRAVDGVSFTLRDGEVLGLVGESGCGKTTVGRCIVRLYRPTSGELLYHETEDLTRNPKKLRIHVRHIKAKDDASQGHVIDLAKLSLSEMKWYRREIRMVFQDPYSSLNPRMTVKDIIGEPLAIHGVARGKAAEQRVAELMEAVGLNPALMCRYPHEFSGGQRQRIGLARTLSLNPRLIIADEPISALDVSIQAQVLNLLQDLQARLGLTLIFIAHDLSVVEHISDRIAVMYVGKIVETADTNTLLHQPLHPYTEALLSAIPPADPDIHPDRIRLQGEVPSPANPPSGCIFHPRCRYAKPECSQHEPHLVEVTPEHFVSCHFAKELSLKGIKV